ncbi:hypothetical protein [Streptomyces sp. HF10]|uniref:hypothetical protein n=1 Tax=Streptomyces sp. HF10 TaxID=2692233 RepID=UPI0013171884|nr:hypothetical protein [Streptomyces sp. HF10]QHC32753.1 hypothetical protein GR129_32240 [Streptomyces sp. HF10]
MRTTLTRAAVVLMVGLGAVVPLAAAAQADDWNGPEKQYSHMMGAGQEGVGSAAGAGYEYVNAGGPDGATAASGGFFMTGAGHEGTGSVAAGSNEYVNAGGPDGATAASGVFFTADRY